MNILNSGRFGMAAGAAGGLRRLLGKFPASPFAISLKSTFLFSSIALYSDAS